MEFWRRWGGEATWGGELLNEDGGRWGGGGGGASPRPATMNESRLLVELETRSSANMEMSSAVATMSLMQPVMPVSVAEGGMGATTHGAVEGCIPLWRV